MRRCAVHYAVMAVCGAAVHDAVMAVCGALRSNGGVRCSGVVAKVFLMS